MIEILAVYVLVSIILWTKAKSVFNVMIWMMATIVILLGVLNIHYDVELMFYMLVGMIVMIPITVMVGGRD